MCSGELPRLSLLPNLAPLVASARTVFSSARRP